MPKKSKLNETKRSTTKDKTSAKYGDQSVMIGAAGEVHQTAGGDVPVLTTQQGIPVSDDQNSLKIGARGPTALEDFHFREKLFHFDHDRIPERVVHARGFGAHGYFENYESLADITRADLFQRAGEKTPVFVRFSTVAGNKGSPDLARDVRGLAVKIYTRQGNWDIVETISRCSSFKTRSNSLTWSMPPSRNRIAGSRRHRRRTTTFGILFL